jgi:protein ImuB
MATHQKRTGQQHPGLLRLTARFPIAKQPLPERAPGTATADVTGLAADERLPALRRAVASLAALALPTTAGLAATPLLALYAAHHAACAPSLSLSREARDPVVVVTDARAFLDPLPLATAAPPPALAQILAGWGVHTLGALTDLPRADITLRLGAAGAALWARAAGETTRPLHPVSPPREFSGAFAFEDAVETLEPLLFILRRLIDRLTLELTAAGFVAEELSLALTLADESTHTRTFRLPEPSAAPDLLFRALHTHLESLHTPSPIAALHLHVTPVRPLVRQHGLFDSTLRDPHGFSESLARAVAVVGSGRVGTPQRADTHRPDAVALSPPASADANVRRSRSPLIFSSSRP